MAVLLQIAQQVFDAYVSGQKNEFVLKQQRADAGGGSLIPDFLKTAVTTSLTAVQDHSALAPIVISAPTTPTPTPLSITTPLTLPVAVADATSTTAATGNVLNNDSGTLITVSAVNGQQANVGTQLTGTFGFVIINPDGSYVYTLAPNDPDTLALAQGQTGFDVFTYTIADPNGATSSAPLSITVTGTNDLPIVAGTDVTGVVLLNPGSNLGDSGTIAFTDVDLTDAHSISPTITPSAGALGTLTAIVTTDTTGSGVGGVITWNYSVADAAVAYLAANQTKLETFTFTLDDGNGGTIQRTISVTITGANDAPTITAEVATPTLVDTAALDTFAAGDRPAGRCRRRYRCEPELPDRRPGPGRVGDTVLAGFYGTLTVHANGSYSYAPNAAAINALTAPTTDVFNVQVSDGIAAAATTLTVNITGANDAPTITAEVATPTLVDTAALDTFAAGDRPAGRCRRRCRCEPELPDRRPGPGRVRRHRAGRHLRHADGACGRQLQLCAQRSGDQRPDGADHGRVQRPGFRRHCRGGDDDADGEHHRRQ